MRKMKAVVSALFLIVVAINMMWSFAIKSFATNESPQQRDEPLDTGQSIEDGSPKNATEIEDITKHPIVILFDFVFWRAIGEAVTNFMKLLFEKNKGSKNSKKGKPKNKKNKKHKKKKMKKK